MWPRQRRTHEDFTEEIQAHLALEADRLVQEGLSPDEARLAAERRFGNVTRVQERFYESGRWMWKDRLVQDLRGAGRAMAKYPVACAVAVVSLAAGIGAATITLALRDTIFYNTPPSYRGADRLSHVVVATPARARGSATGGLLQAWTGVPPDVAELAGAGRAAFKDVTFPDRVETLAVRPATRNLFAALGVRPLHGRGFDELPAEAAAPPVMLSYRHWRRYFDGRPEAVGTTILVDGVPHVIVGVMPAGFWFVSDQPPLWTLLDVSRLTRETAVDVVARRGSATSAVALQDRLQAMAAPVIGGLPPDQREMRVQAIGVGGTPIGNNVGPMPVLLVVIAVVLTLVIACANVASLMIAQWTAREHEIAIRASLGGSRWRLVRALVTESTTIAILGGGLGVLVTLALRGVLTRLDRSGEQLYDLSINPRVFVTVAAITLLAGLLTGLAPALYETRRLQTNPLQLLRTNDRVRQWWRHALVAFEIAVTVALLVVTGAVLSAYDRTAKSDLGFDTHPLFVLRLEHPDGVATTDTLNHLRTYPGIAAAAVATAVPTTSPGPQRQVAAADTGSVAISAEAVSVGSGFFDTLGVRIASGRDFTAGERSAAARVVVVNDLLAAQLWPGRPAIGEVLHVEGIAHEVIGIVPGYANFALRPVKPMFFLPIAEDAPGVTRVQFVMRAAAIRRR